MKSKLYLVGLIPILSAILGLFITGATSLLSMPSDIAVGTGFLLALGAVYFVIFSIKFINKYFFQNEKTN